jgi:hypothetical protein
MDIYLKSFSYNNMQESMEEKQENKVAVSKLLLYIFSDYS